MQKNNEVKTHPVNNNIRAQRVLLLDEHGAKLGEFGIAEALHRASEKDLDLVQMSPPAQEVKEVKGVKGGSGSQGSTNEVAVCRIMNYESWAYHDQKKRQKQELSQRRVDLKEMRFRPGIDEHDFEIKLIKVREFMEEGSRVKITLQMRGRELGNRVAQTAFIERFEEAFANTAVFDTKPKPEGRTLTFILRPEKKVIPVVKATVPKL